MQSLIGVVTSGNESGSAALYAKNAEVIFRAAGWMLLNFTDAIFVKLISGMPEDM